VRREEVRVIVILNGSVGVGKTSVSWAINEGLGRSVMLDGDYLGAVQPFDIYDEARVSYLYKTLAHLIGFHREHGYKNFVVNYVFESPESLSELVGCLRPLDRNIHTFWLTCTEAEQRERILKRRTDGWRWELERFTELNAILEAASQRGDIGVRLDTTGKAVGEIVGLIRQRLKVAGTHTEA
jgi:chloramphenicol 3-O-phosphotransferase